jgi:RNA polymerase sigma factor (sigma-70 family)
MDETQVLAVEQVVRWVWSWRPYQSVPRDHYEDILSEVLACVLKWVRKADPKPTLEYLRNFARETAVGRFKNHFRQAARQQRRRSDVDWQRAEETFPATSLDPLQACLQRERQERVGAAIKALPEDQEAVIILVDLEGLSLAEAAEELGIPIGTAKSQRHRGWQRLKELLGD